MKKLITFGILLVLMAVGVTAYADINYQFNTNNVVAEAYDCLDSECNSVGPFSGTFPDGQSTNNGELTIVYPSELATPHGYAVFYFSPGMLPMEGVATWHTYGDNDHYEADYNIDFEQKDSCHATVDTFSITNDAYANEPLVINMYTSLDATTYSAFKETDTGVGYVPGPYKDEYYSVDTRVVLTIQDSNGNVVNTQTRELSAANGNPLYMDTSERVMFEWLPQSDGTYTATMETQVIDNQCAASEDSETSQNVMVYPERPTDECYTILNSLAGDDPYPEADQEIEFTYTKISNYADANHVMTAIPTDVDYYIYDEAGSIVYSTSTTLSANPDTVNPNEQEFSWTPLAEGWYNITVEGNGYSGLCAGRDNYGNSLSLMLYVDGMETYDLTFQLSDALTGRWVEGANVDIGVDSDTSGSNGQARFAGLLPGDYPYEIRHSGYATETGVVEITDTDWTQLLTLTPNQVQNTPPVVRSIPDVNMDEGTVNSDIDLDDYVIDSESADSELSWAYSGNSNIGVSIGADHVVTFTAPNGWTGSEHITFTVTDPDGASDNDRMTVTVDGVNDAPEISGIPDFTLNENTHLFDAVYLPDYASDTETPSFLLDYSIASVSDSGCGVSIDGNNRLDIQPVQDWNGACTVDVEVSDGSLTDQDTFTVTVTEVNSAPTVTISANPTSGQAPLIVEFTSNAQDVDGTIASYLWNFGDSNVSTQANTTHTYTEPGTYTATLTVTDDYGESTVVGVIIRVSGSSLEDDESWKTSALYMSRMGLYSGEVLSAGETMRLSVSFENVRDLDLDNLKLSLSVPDMGIWRFTRLPELDSGDDVHEVIDLEIPDDAEPGLYDYRVSITDDEVRKVKVRQFWVV